MEYLSNEYPPPPFAACPLPAAFSAPFLPGAFVSTVLSAITYLSFRGPIMWRVGGDDSQGCVFIGKRARRPALFRKLERVRGVGGNRDAGTRGLHVTRDGV